MIIAERIHLKWIGDLIGWIFLCLLCVGGVIASAILGSKIGLIISLGFLILFFILMIVNTYKATYNNDLPKDVILYKKGVFIFIDEDGSELEFFPEDILDMDYKLKVTNSISPYFSQTKTWNYGRLRIWLSISDNEEERVLLDLKNIAEPDRVVDRILFIMEQEADSDE